MDDLRVGSLVRAVRHRLRWTQAEVAARANVSQQVVSKIETGQLDRATVSHIRRVAAVLEIRMPFAPQWRGGDGVRLLDADHARIVNRVVSILATAGWETVVEYSFNHYGERGSVDVIAWNAKHRALILVEVKSRLVDTQATIAILGRKARIVPSLLAAERGWEVAVVGVALVLDDLTANRRAVSLHAATFDAAYPDRGRAARSWLRRPDRRLSAVWFLSSTTSRGTTRLVTSPKRVRRARPRSDGPP